MATANLKIPSIKEILKTGLQFGHNSSRWNPKMRKYIFSQKNGIHVVDVVKTRQLLEEAVNYLKGAAVENHVLFVATKRQASTIVEEQAKRVGAYYIVDRWPGGLFTNFRMVQQSFKKLKNLEKAFEQGVEDRTKYEITQMKAEWERLNRLYRGVKEMEKLPAAIVVIDPNYERVAVREANLVGIPIVALVDTNSDPDVVDYIIPGNDDAIRSIEMITNVLADAVATGNGGKGVKHNLTDYSKADVEIKQRDIDNKEEDVIVAVDEASVRQPKVRVSAAQQKKALGDSKGILERAKERKK